MAAAEVASRPADRVGHKRPFASWLKRMTKSAGSKKGKKAGKNNPYPESGRPDQHHQSPSDSSQAGRSNASRTDEHRRSYSSLPESRLEEGEVYNSSRSAAPTVATQPETIHSDAGYSHTIQSDAGYSHTIHSDAGYSRALTGTTAGGGALSSIDGAGPNSTFSSPTQSTHSLTTTLTTIQSTNANTPINHSSIPHQPSLNPDSQAGLPFSVQFTHQYPVTVSAIPAHLQAPAQQQHQPTTYASATAHNLLTDNASILTLASSSKRRRRSIDTDASVRAMAPHSVWGNSSESLPLSVLSANTLEPVRPSAIPRDERASVYSHQGVSAPALVSDRNSYYATSQRGPVSKDVAADGRSVRSMQLPYSPLTAADSKSVNFDAASLRGHEGSVRSGALGHGRNESVSGSPIGSPSLPRRPSGAISLSVGDEGVREDELEEAREEE